MKNQTQALEQASIQQYCKTVRVPVIGANFVTLAEQAVKENHSPDIWRRCWPWSVRSATGTLSKIEFGMHSCRG